MLIIFQLPLRSSIAYTSLRLRFSITVSNYLFSRLSALRDNWTFSKKGSYSSVQLKANLEVPVRFSFQGLPSFLGKEKSTKSSCFPTGSFFIHPPLTFGTQSFIISLKRINFCIRLLGLVQVCKYSVLPNFRKISHLIVRAILWKFCKWKMQRNQN